MAAEGEPSLHFRSGAGGFLNPQGRSTRCERPAAARVCDDDLWYAFAVPGELIQRPIADLLKAGPGFCQRTAFRNDPARLKQPIVTVNRPWDGTGRLPERLFERQGKEV